MTTSNIEVTFVGQNAADQRVTIRVSGIQYKSFTPIMAGIGSGIPIQVSIPLEQP